MGPHEDSEGRDVWLGQVEAPDETTTTGCKVPAKRLVALRR
jgi:hypothetical protein